MKSKLAKVLHYFPFFILTIFRVIFSEGYANISMTMLYYGNEQGDIGAHFPFNFDFITDVSAESNARDLVYTVLKWLTHMPFGAVANWQVSEWTHLLAKMS